MTIAWMNPKGIKFLTIHCTATPKGRDNTAAEVRAWDIERFGQPSYHYVVELDGDVIHELRDDQRGAHVAKNNTGNIGMSYVGGTDTLDHGATPMDTRTPAQKASMEQTVRNYVARFPNIKIRGHRDWPGVSKACPSFDVKTWLTEIGLGRYFG